MLFNFIVGLCIPWVFGAILYKIDKAALLLAAPIDSAIAFLVNTIGFHFGLWNLYPWEVGRVVDVFFDIGLYPINASYMLYFIRKGNKPPLLIIFIFTIVTTLEEYTGVILGRVVYGDGWNIGYTICAYLIPYIICYEFYKLLKDNGYVREQ